jgi:hypothetical protein
MKPRTRADPVRALRTAGVRRGTPPAALASAISAGVPPERFSR